MLRNPSSEWEALPSFRKNKTFPVRVISRIDLTPVGRKTLRGRAERGGGGEVQVGGRDKLRVLLNTKYYLNFFLLQVIREGRNDRIKYRATWEVVIVKPIFDVEYRPIVTRRV